MSSWTGNRIGNWAGKTLALLLLACTPALTACQTDSPSAQASAQSSAQAAPQEAAKPPTHQEAALICWASVDKAHPTMGLDQRADIVTKCINDKTKAPPAPKG
jgi:hypothetical protein